MTEKVYKNKTPFGTVYPEICFQCRKIWGVNCETHQRLGSVSAVIGKFEFWTDVCCDFDSKYPNKKIFVTKNI